MNLPPFRLMKPAFKDEILRWPENFRAEWDERAGILEYEVGMTRQQAEWKAYLDVKRRMVA